MKLVHAADLHIDSPLGGISRYEGIAWDEVRTATRQAFHNLVSMCLEERADLLLLAGDLFDQEWRDYNTGLFFLAELARLRDVGTRVVLLRGNHDAAGHITKRLRLPPHVRELSSETPETVVWDDLGLAVHGQGFRTRAVTDNLVPTFGNPVPGLINVGLLHTSLDGRPGHDTYAPCTVSDLVCKGYDYWALGHVHTREVIHDHIVFPGNLQGRHMRETGPKGATLVTFDGTRPVVTHRSLDVVRFEVAHVAVSPPTEDALLEAARGAFSRLFDASEGRVLAVRLLLQMDPSLLASCTREEDRLRGELAALLTEITGGRGILERVRLEEAPSSPDSLRFALGAIPDDPSFLEILEADLAPLRSKLPPEFASRGVDFRSKEELLSLCQEAHALLRGELEREAL